MGLTPVPVHAMRANRNASVMVNALLVLRIEHCWAIEIAKNLAGYEALEAANDLGFAPPRWYVA